MRRIILYSVGGGLLIALLKFIEYQHFIRSYPAEIYGGLIAVIFTAIGIRLGLRWTRVVSTAVTAEGRKNDLGITPREHEVLGLIAQGLSNREIAEKLFVSENTVKTHSSRLFDKMSVSRRVQAVQRGRELGLLP